MPYIRNKELTIEDIRKQLAQKAGWREMDNTGFVARGIAFIVVNDSTREIIAFRDYAHARRMLTHL